jgi:hypothetical protein
VEQFPNPALHALVRPRLHALLAALGFASSFGALADKGGPSGGVSNGLGWGRGGSRFVDAAGSGPASAFDQHANLVKVGGLEFQAMSKGRPSASSSSSAGGKIGDAAPAGINSSGDAALSKTRMTVAENELAELFAPWKISDKEGKPAGKKSRPECATK